MKIISLLARAISAVLLATGSIAEANSVPKLINYQGKLVLANNTELNGTHVLRFELFDAATAGTLVWGESQQVAVVNGVFNVLLGGGQILNPAPPVTDLSFAFGSASRFLQTTIVSGPDGAMNQTLAPRQQLASVPYAMSSPGVVPIGGVVMWWGRIDQTPSGFVPCNGLPVNDQESPLLGKLTPDLRDRFPLGALAGTVDASAPVVTGGSHQIGQRTSDPHTLTEAQMPEHRHLMHEGLWQAADDTRDNHDWSHPAVADKNSAGTKGFLTGPKGGSQPHSHGIPSHDNRPAFLRIHYIIRIK